MVVVDPLAGFVETGGVDIANRDDATGGVAEEVAQQAVALAAEADAADGDEFGGGGSAEAEGLGADDGRQVGGGGAGGEKFEKGTAGQPGGVLHEKKGADEAGKGS